MHFFAVHSCLQASVAAAIVAIAAAIVASGYARLMCRSRQCTYQYVWCEESNKNAKEKSHTNVLLLIIRTKFFSIKTTDIRWIWYAVNWCSCCCHSNRNYLVRGPFAIFMCVSIFYRGIERRTEKSTHKHNWQRGKCKSTNEQKK